MNFTMTLREAKEGFLDRKKIQTLIGRQSSKALSKFGAFVRTRARTSIRKRRGTSEPGHPPYSHLGLLRSGILFSYDKAKQAVVIGPIKLNKGGEAPALLEYGGEATIEVGSRRRRKNVRARYRARPYMRPAFNEELKDLPKFWRQSVR